METNVINCSVFIGAETEFVVIPVSPNQTKTFSSLDDFINYCRNSK